MHSFRQPLLGCLLLGLLVVGGCQKLSTKGTETLLPGDVKSVEISAPRYRQQVTVEIQSTKSPLDVHIVFEEDRAAAMDSLQAGKVPPRVVVSKRDVKEDKVEAPIPAGKAFAILFCNAKGETTVNYTINGR